MAQALGVSLAIDRNPAYDAESAFPYDERLKRDKLNLDIFWLKDELLEPSATLPDPEVLALEIAENSKQRWSSLPKSQKI